MYQSAKEFVIWILLGATVYTGAVGIVLAMGAVITHLLGPGESAITTANALAILTAVTACYLMVKSKAPPNAGS